MAADDDEPGIDTAVSAGGGGSVPSVTPPSVTAAAPGVPYNFPPTPPPATNPRDQARERIDRLIERSEALDRRQENVFEQKRQALEPIEKETLEATREPVPQPPQLEKPPPRPNLQMQLNEQSQAWMGLATVIAMIGAGKTRNAGTTGLMAMAGIFTGLREGNEDRIRHDFDVWKQANEVIKETNRELVEQYKLTLNSKKLNLDQKIEEMKIIATQFDDQSMAIALERRNLIDAGKLITGNEKIADQAETALLKARKLEAQIEDIQQKTKQRQSGEFTDDEARAMAARKAEGYKPTSTDYGGWNNRAANAKKVQDMEAEWAEDHGLSMEEYQQRLLDISAAQTGARRSYTQEANITLPLNEMKRTIPLADRAIDEYWQATGDSGFLALRWNELTNTFAREQQNPQLSALAARLNEVMAPYSSAMSRSGASTDATRAEAQKILSEAKSPEAAKASLRALYEGVLAIQDAPKEVRDKIRKDTAAPPSKSAPPAPPSTATPPRPYNVPPGSAFSPSRQQWKAPDGKIYKPDGTPIL